MEVSDAIKLIEKGVDSHSSGTWLDLGAGDGLFTKAIAELTEHPSTIIAIDLKPGRELKSLSHPRHRIEVRQADFTAIEKLPSGVDGILLANALHFVREKKRFLNGLSRLLKRNGRLLTLEYDLPRANPWVPYPIRESDLRSLVIECGFSDPVLIGERMSTLNNSRIYSLMCCIK
jgi:ubiquinone/menaquinone biosynthesis C-methylase UbiE